jgi:glycine/sarcosine N-methyltransferase
MMMRKIKSLFRYLLSKWRGIAQRAPRLNQGLATVFAGLVIRGVLVGFGISFPAPSVVGQVGILLNLIGEVALDILIGFLTYLLIRTLTRLSLGPIFPALAFIRDFASGPEGSAILGIADGQLRKLNQVIRGLRSERGTIFDRSDTNYATRVLFETAENGYDGTESHCPSEFEDVYPDYLEAHAKNLQKTKSPPGTRILIANRAELVDDAHHHESKYQKFVEWHVDHEVNLLYVERNEAEQISKKNKLPTTDVGIWYDQYALLFTPQEQGNVVLRMVVPREKTYGDCVRYFQEISNPEIAKPVPYQPELFEEALSNKWVDFVNSNERMKLLGPFLLNILEPYKHGRILDAAAGIGCETIFLAKNGYDVTTNEIGKRLSEIARINARREEVVFERFAIDWRFLDEHYPQPRFNAILVLGNSLCLVLDEEERKKCVENFYKVLRPGGVLIIDERNFDNILSMKDEIEQDSVKAFNKIWKGNVMYCGSIVRGVPHPYNISENRIVFVYYDNESPKSSWEEAKSSMIGTLEMYPFKNGELYELLESCGFQQIETYSDLERDVKKDPSADFYTYVAHKNM